MAHSGHGKELTFMSEKRRDHKGRILRTGESQRKDGRYAYKYTDILGKPRFVYAWKLTQTDKTPAGKKDDRSLREKIKDIQKDLDDGIHPLGKSMTLCELCQRQMDHRGNVRQKTKMSRLYFMKALRNDPLGAWRIDQIKLSDAKDWVIRMKDKGVAYQTIDNYRRSLAAAFYLAIQDDCVRKNPFSFTLSEVIANDKKTKEVLSKQQEKILLDFLRKDHIYGKYLDDLIILLGTGLRISELCGLTIADIDFEARIIHVDHQLLRDTKAGYYINPPKTAAGFRKIPMSEAVYQALKRIIEKEQKPDAIVVDGYRDFLFCNRKGFPRVCQEYRSIIHRMVMRYNKKHEEKLPHMTPHGLRHTYCTQLALAGMNPKALQYLMGHSSISITLDYYAHVTFESAQAEFEKISL